MRKAIVVSVVVFLVCAYALPAGAINFSPGNQEFKAKLEDWSSLYTPAGVPRASGVNPQPGDEGRALVRITDIRPYPTGAALWVTPNGGELTVLEYNFYVPPLTQAGALWPGWEWNGAAYVPILGGIGGLTGSEVLWVSGGTLGLPGAAGQIDVWEDKTPDFDTGFGGNPVPSQGPAAWLTGLHAGHDDYPGASDILAGGPPYVIDPSVSLWLTGAFVPLFFDANLDGYRDPGEPDLAIFDSNLNGVIDPTDVRAVYHITGYNPFGAGSINAWIDFTGGSFLWSIQQDWYDKSGNPAEYDAVLTGVLKSPSYGWGVASEDPVRMMGFIPEPATLTLLGAALCGLLGLARRKKTE